MLSHRHGDASAGLLFPNLSGRLGRREGAAVVHRAARREATSPFGHEHCLHQLSATPPKPHALSLSVSFEILKPVGPPVSPQPGQDGQAGDEERANPAAGGGTGGVGLSSEGKVTSGDGGGAGGALPL